MASLIAVASATRLSLVSSAGARATHMVHTSKAPVVDAAENSVSLARWRPFGCSSTTCS